MKPVSALHLSPVTFYSFRPSLSYNLRNFSKCLTDFYSVRNQGFDPFETNFHPEDRGSMFLRNFGNSTTLRCVQIQDTVIWITPTVEFWRLTVVVDRDSSVGISDSLRAGRSGDRIPVRVRFSASVQNGPGAHPVFYIMGTVSFLRGKAAGAWR
jgi:hypothetical protein